MAAIPPMLLVIGLWVIFPAPRRRGKLFVSEPQSVKEEVIDRLTDKAARAYMKAHRAQMDFLETCQRKPIGLPYDGKSFDDPDLQSFLERLLILREVGYRFPDSVIETVRKEIEKEAKL